MNLDLAKGWFCEDLPRHKVSVVPFFLDIHEVTNREFRSVVIAIGYEAEGPWQRNAKAKREEHPVVNVTWNDAMAYAKWAGKRLPTETEWEWAARGGSTHRWFPWGDRDDEFVMANYGHYRSFLGGTSRIFDRRVRTLPVGTYDPNGYGLYDMIGNVFEWCATELTPYPGAFSDCWSEDKEAHSGQPDKVVRGGGWKTPNPVFARVNRRSGMAAREQRFDAGFRCAMSFP